MLWPAPQRRTFWASPRAPLRKFRPRRPSDLIQLGLQGVAIIGIPRTSAGPHAKAFLQGHRQAGFHAELVGLVGFPLGQALHLRCMQGVELLLVLPFLGQQAADQGQHLLERRLRRGPVRQLALNIAVHPLKDHLQPADFTLGALELFGLGVASVAEGRMLGRPRVALTEGHPVSLGQLHQSAMGLRVQARVCGVRDGLGLHRCIHDDLVHAALGDRARRAPGLDGELEQPLTPAFADPLAPPRHLRRMDRQLVLEELLPGEVLPVGILFPAGHHLLVRKRIGVLQEVESSHESDGYRRAPVVEAGQ